ncbi:DUF1540 domain-containing protein [Cohnella nanjingensis]|uniref:DUF1540 domain-containing protein n=1 Tax=Cohnella nanjingensis TaxID=1387779 RepID=A0A7X0VIJ3_9BACL|nr:DUF1540 domain-containing protein [Cohnella nanjingensis]MBB6675280.1 DUF1540 domain-containing protein [Cohnella nanjingensis]
MPNGVACSVSNCSFWGEGNRCAAQEIAIEIDAHAKRNLNEEFADESFEAHQDQASSSKATCCLTFRPKEERQ